MTKSKNRSEEWIICGLITVIVGILPAIFFNLWLLSDDPGWGLHAIVPIMSGILMLMGIMVILVGLVGKYEKEGN